MGLSILLYYMVFRCPNQVREVGYRDFLIIEPENESEVLYICWALIRIYGEPSVSVTEQVPEIFTAIPDIIYDAVIAHRRYQLAHLFAG